MMDRAVLDTDTVSALMRNHPRAVEQASKYLARFGSLTVSAITRYEVLRGLEAKDATRQIEGFHRFCESLEVLPVTDDVLVRAAAIYGDLHRRGQLVGDADILIAATCLVHGCAVVTNNTTHFERVTGLNVGNWLAG